MDYKKQAFFNTVGNVVYLGCTWLLTVLVVRISGYDDAGVLSIAMSVGNIFYFIGMYGMRSFQSSDVIHKYSDKTYIITRFITVGISILLCVLYLAAGHLFGNGYPLYTAAAVLIYLLYRSLEAGSDVLFGELQKDGRLEVCGISMSVKGVVSVIVFFVLLKLTNLNVAMLGMVAVALLLLVFYDYNRFKALHKEPDTPAEGTVKGLLIEGFPLLLTTLFPIIVTALPRLALEFYYDETLLGIYASICSPTVIITTLVPNILCPFMTLYGKLYQKGENGKIMKSFLVSLLLTVALGAVACLCAWLLGDWALSLLYDEQILEYTYIFIPIIIATVVYALSMCGNSVLISIRTPVALTVFSGAALVVCALISYPLTKAYGMWGTVFGFGLPFLVQLILQTGYIIYMLLIKKKNIVKEASDDGEQE